MDSHTKKTCVRAIQIFFFYLKIFAISNIQYIKLHRLYVKICISEQMHAFSIKNKKTIIQQTDVGRRRHTIDR